MGQLARWWEAGSSPSLPRHTLATLPIVRPLTRTNTEVRLECQTMSSLRTVATTLTSCATPDLTGSVERKGTTYAYTGQGNI